MVPRARASARVAAVRRRLRHPSVVALGARLTTTSARPALCALAGVGALLLPVVVVPRATHTGWSSIAREIGTVSLWQLGVLAAVWLAGLYVHTFVSTGALPGLTHRRAMALNFSGSTVSHL